MKHGRAGRKTVLDLRTHGYYVRLTDRENARFLTLFERSGTTTKSKFILDRIFGKDFRVIPVADPHTIELCAQLTAIVGQFRAVGVNYNQYIKIMHSNFSPKAAVAYTYKLEKATEEMTEIGRQVVRLCEKYEQECLRK